MTYTEYFSAICSRFNFTETDIQILLLNQAALIPDPDEDVDVNTAKRALYKEFSSMIPLYNVSEGGYSVSWNIEALKLWYSAIANELGLEDVTKPRLRNKSNVW